MDGWGLDQQYWLKIWRQQLSQKLRERAGYDQAPPPGELDLIREYRARIREIKDDLRRQGGIIRDVSYDEDPADPSGVILQSLSENQLPPSPAVPLATFVKYFAQALQTEKGFRAEPAPGFEAAFVGTRETVFELQSIALVEATDLNLQSVNAIDKTYFRFLRAWQIHGLKRVVKKNGLLCLVFGQSPSLRNLEAVAKLIATVAALRQRGDSNPLLDAALTLTWVIDLGRRNVFTASRFAGVFPPTFSIVYPGKSYLQQLILRLDGATTGAPQRRLFSWPFGKPTSEASDLAYMKKIIAHRKPVASVHVPKIVNGMRQEGGALRGTGWLIAPDLLLTCWHVVEVRQLFDVGITNADRDAQVAGSTVKFDFTTAAESGVEYSIAWLECYSTDLDYALLRLEDRAAQPLRQWGTLKMNRTMPLASGSAIYVIQFPLGMPQQYSMGGFVREESRLPAAFLHNARAEHGTSGAPIIRTPEWEVVALHRGRSLKGKVAYQAAVDPQPPELYLATRITAVWQDIAAQRPDLLPLISSV